MSVICYISQGLKEWPINAQCLVKYLWMTGEILWFSNQELL